MLSNGPAIMDAASSGSVVNVEPMDKKGIAFDVDDE